jgi:murein L,D-transpeptidase YcbB/YkuD
VVRKAVKKAQAKFDLLNDGVLRSTALEQLNMPLQARMDRLVISVNYYRWIRALVQSRPVILVNIPAAYLKVYKGNSVLLEMRMVVGKPSTPTPTLTSTVTEVILYPYWVVPHSIIANEMLPTLRSNPGYIDAGNYQVLDRRGKIVDHRKINWSAVSASNFPYIIRQSTGCDNALGLLKLNFYNPFTVYLHDTPSKSLFMTKRRYYSHGCMRMEKPMELGHMVLGNNQVAIDTLEDKGCLRNQSPVYVPAEHKMPVIVWYNPVDIDPRGQVVFYEDVYKRFPRTGKTSSR